jgi:transglutaminase-like putative cysteine protease
MVKVLSYTIADKDRGTMQTLRIMSSIVNESLLDPYVREYTKKVVEYANPRNNLELANTINSFLSDHFMFIRDPSGIELLHTPNYMIGQIEKKFYFQADCDDFSILAASMAKAVGMQATFVVYAFPQSGGEYAHVFAIAKVTDKWYPFDRNVQYPPGNVHITRRAYYPI